MDVLASVLAGMFILAYGLAGVASVMMVAELPGFQKQPAHDLSLSTARGTLLADAKPSITWETPESIEAVHIPISLERRVWEESKGVKSFHIEHMF